MKTITDFNGNVLGYTESKGDQGIFVYDLENNFIIRYTINGNKVYLYDAYGGIDMNELDMTRFDADAERYDLNDKSFYYLQKEIASNNGIPFSIAQRLLNLNEDLKNELIAQGIGRYNLIPVEVIKPLTADEQRIQDISDKLLQAEIRHARMLELRQQELANKNVIYVEQPTNDIPITPTEDIEIYEIYPLEQPQSISGLEAFIPIDTIAPIDSTPFTETPIIEMPIEQPTDVNGTPDDIYIDYGYPLDEPKNIPVYNVPEVEVIGKKPNNTLIFVGLGLLAFYLFTKK